jgi:hypothetical protein
MTAANGSAPAIDARELRSARKRAFTAAGKAIAALADEAARQRDALAAGEMPPGSPAVLRKAAEKYFALLETLDIMDSLLTPEALEVIYAEHAEPGQVAVSREDLALLTSVITSLHPEVPADDRTPLGRLTRAAHPGGLTPEMAAAVTEPDPGFPPQGS